MHDIINGERVDLTSEQISEREAEASINTQVQAGIDLINSKEQQKNKLRLEKIDSMLIVEFEEIDAATTKETIKAIKIK